MSFFEAHQHRFIQPSSRFSQLQGSLLQSGLSACGGLIARFILQPIKQPNDKQEIILESYNRVIL